ncbi:MAG: adenosylhomocysteinase [Candidatus Bipolaricaulaceae bacterium]
MDVNDELVAHGAEKISWARAHMPVLGQVARELAQAGTLAGLRVAMSIHLEAKTACLALALRDAGAQLAVTGSNPLSTQDEVAAALAAQGVTVHAHRGASTAEYWQDLTETLAVRPQLVLDDGGDLTALLHGSGADLGAEVRGICEQTTTGVVRLRKLAAAGELRWPAVAVNDARMKHLFDNRYGTGQSTWDALMRATNLLVAGKEVVVAGYGWCGRGVAQRARGLGARVTVCEVDPVRAAEALVEGFSVAPLGQAVRNADFVITATGCRDVVPFASLLEAKDGVVLANAGHFDVEVDVEGLRRHARARRVRAGVDEYRLPNGRRVYVVAEGRLVNLVAGDGHPVEIMDLSFALQALSLTWLVERCGALPPAVYPVPDQVDTQVAHLFLDSCGVAIDLLTTAQRAYLGL